MKRIPLIVPLMIVALLLPLAGCRQAQPATPTGKLVIGIERIGIAIAIDRVTKAVLNDPDLSPAQRQAAVSALVALPDVISNPTASNAVEKAWVAAKPLLQEYSEGPKAVIGPATFGELSKLMDQYVADLKAAEVERATPTTRPTLFEPLPRA